ncbi:MAG: TIR domain-containing protein [Phycisphaerae bacterium]|nr:TIR domain-containing protein [Phycisphaerae bacterium]
MEDDFTYDVFLSHSSKDKAIVREVAARLRKNGLRVWLDECEIRPGDSIPTKIEEGLEHSRVLVLCMSKNAFGADWVKLESHTFRFRDPLNRERRFVPLRLDDAPIKGFLQQFRYINWHPEHTEQEHDELIEACRPSARPVASEDSWPSERFDFDHVPEVGCSVLGREDDLRFLDEAWENETLNVACLVAGGGVGKTALVRKWLDGMRAHRYARAERGYGWSFYSQGIGDRVVSSEAFIDRALRTWFDDKSMADSSYSPWDKGRRLAQHVQRDRCLLILDGLEPLQSSFSDDRGRIHDLAIASLVEHLAEKNPGLCVITTRESVPDLRGRSHTIQNDLEQISDQTGGEILRASVVKGTDQQLQQLTRDFGNHALAISLIGAFLAGQHVTNAANIPDLPTAKDTERSAWRAIMAIMSQLQDPTQLQIARLLGLFDRPATAADVEFLRSKTSIPGLTHLLGEGSWTPHVANLRRLRLLLPESRCNRNGIDAHPVVRAYFRSELKKDQTVWRQANAHLFDHFASVPKTHRPDEFGDMEPLYRAIDHGCHAERYQEAFEVLEDRLRRGDEHHTFFRGFLGAERTAIGRFFTRPWTDVVEGDLEPSSQAWLLNEAGSILRVTGHFEDALSPIRRSIDMYEEQGDYTHASRSTATLVNVYMLMGKLEDARNWALKAVVYVDKSQSIKERIAKYSFTSRVFWYLGRHEEARAWIHKADALQSKAQDADQLRNGLHETIWCEELSDEEEWDDVASKMEDVLQWLPVSNKRSRALVLSTLGLAKFFLGKWDEGRMNLDWGIHVYRETGRQDELPRVLLARARCRISTGAFESAREDLKESMEIALRFGMRLYEADVSLEYARLLLAERMPDRSAAQENLANVKRIIEETGYRRLSKELDRLTERAG